jgi:hypothetical protein
MQHGFTESYLSAFRIGVAALLQDNTSLKSLSMLGEYEVKAKDQVTIDIALQC